MIIIVAGFTNMQHFFEKGSYRQCLVLHDSSGLVADHLDLLPKEN